MLAINLIFSIFVIIISSLTRYFESNQVDYLNKYISNISINKVATLDMHLFDNPNIYDKIQQVNSQTITRSVSILRTIISILQNLSITISSSIIFLKFKPLFIIICFFSSIPTLIINLKIANKKYDIFLQRISKIRWIENLKRLMINYPSVKEIKIYRCAAFFAKQIDLHYSNCIKQDKRLRKGFTIKEMISRLIENTISYSFKFYLLMNTIKNKFSLGDLTMYFSLLDNFQNAIESIVNSFSSLYDDMLYVKNFHELIDIEVNDSEINKLPINNFNRISLVNVSFKYPNTQEFILKDISIEMEFGKSYSFVGVNGSVKTTLIKLLLNLYEPTEGNIYIDGINLREIKKNDYYKMIGVVFQDYVKYPLNIEQNIGIGNIEDISNMARIIQSSKYSGADEFINKLPNKYATMVTKELEGAVDLSTGQWQKLSISRAFMSDFKLVILDEPTSSLDAISENEVMKRFKELSYRKTSIMISHRLSSLRGIDCIFVLKNGRIIEYGTHNELISSDNEYSKLYTIQSKGYRIENDI